MASDLKRKSRRLAVATGAQRVAIELDLVQACLVDGRAREDANDKTAARLGCIHQVVAAGRLAKIGHCSIGCKVDLDSRRRGPTRSWASVTAASEAAAIAVTAERDFFIANKRCQEPLFSFFARPCGGNVLSRPNRRTIRSDQAALPLGQPGCTERRGADNSACVCGDLPATSSQRLFVRRAASSRTPSKTA